MVPGQNVVAGPYAGDGITTALSYPNYFIAISDLVVWQANSASTPVVSQLILNRDYTVSGSLDPTLLTYSGGATVTMLVAPPVGFQTWIARQTAKTQGSKLPPFSNVPGALTAIEVALDRLTLIEQEGSNSVVGNVVGVAFGPPTQAGLLNQILLNGAPVPGGNVGWICTTPGQPGIVVWNPYGNISLLPS